MNAKFKIVFIGGLSNGIIVYNYLSKNQFVDLQLCITYPDDSVSKPRFVPFPSATNIIKTNYANDYIEKIKILKPDLIFVVGWSELLFDELLKIPDKGVIGFHPSKLPFDRGRSVLAWQIAEGYSETALTMFYYTDIPDGGDIIAQEKIPIENNDNINDILNKVDLATKNLIYAYFPLVRKGIAPRLKQDINIGTFRRLRNETDSRISWKENAVSIYNLIRAISYPYPGAFFNYKDSKIRVYEAEILEYTKMRNLFPLALPGEIIAKINKNSYLIKCKDNIIKIKTESNLEVGDIL